MRCNPPPGGYNGRREQTDQQRQPGSCQKEQIANAREEAPGRGFSIFLELLAEHGNQGHRQRPARDQRKEQVGVIIGGVEGINFGREAECTGDDDLAHKTKRFFEGEENAYNEG